MSRSIACLVLAFAPGVAFAYESEPQELWFVDSTDVFAAAEYDTGYLPSGSPLAVRFRIESNGSADTEMAATSVLEWPDALTHSFEGVPGSGFFALVTDVSITASVYFDLFGYTGEYDVWSDGIGMEAGAEFDPLLLPGGVVQQVDIAARDAAIGPIEYEAGVFTGVSLLFSLEGVPEATASLQGRSVDTNDSRIEVEGGYERFDVPEDDPGRLPLESTYVGLLEATLDLLLVPSLSVCVDYVGCYEVASFEIPIHLVTFEEEHRFEPVAYEHPLPSLLPPMASHDFGDVETGTLANLQVPLSNVGDMDVEGTAWIEGGEAFSVWPTYFYASPDQTDGLVVTYAPTDNGDDTALLVIESNDPLNPRLEIPLRGGAFLDDGAGESVTASVSGCGCTTAPAVPGLAWLAGLGALFVVRRRR